MAYRNEEGLTKKEAAFVDAYFISGMNATKAAEKAGYAFPNKDGTVLKNSTLAVRLALQRRFDEMAMGPEEVLGRLSEQASGDYGMYIQKDGTVDFEAILADGKAHLIREISDTKYGKSIKFYDAQAALRTMAKYHKLLSHENHNLNVDLDNLNDEQLEKLEKGESLLKVLMDK